MKKKIVALFTAFTLAMSFGTVSFAENDNNPREAESSTLTTATQKEALEDQDSDVDEDISEEVQSLIPQEIEEVRIANESDLFAFAENCKLDTWSVNKKVILTEDISLVGKSFNGIPTFGGVFDGQGHTISGINITDGISHLGLFVRIQKTGAVLNLNVSGSVLPNGTQINVGGIAGDNYGVIRNCTFKGVVSSSDYVGGITGFNHLQGSIEGCTSQGYITGVHFVGGVAGDNEGNIYRCTNEAFVNTTNTDTQITIDAMATLSKVVNLIKNLNNTDEDANADVTVTDVGGIAGTSIGIISRCINKGDVGYEHVGYNIGGIAGRQSGYTVNCTNNGKILGRKDVGGIVGQAEPYITVDLTSDVAYQLTESIGKLHDLINVTLQDAKGQSDIISARLAAIQQFTAGAIDDVHFLADGTVDFANGVASSTSEAFSRVEYVMEESSKKDGALDQITRAADNTRKSAKSVRKALDDLDIDQYLDESEKEEYYRAKDKLESASQQYAELYDRSNDAYYNYEILINMSEIDPADLIYADDEGNKLDYSLPASKDDLSEDLKEDQDSYGLRQSGRWIHSTDGAEFPVSDKEDPRYESDKKLQVLATAESDSDSDQFAKDNYQGTDGSSYTEDVLDATTVISKYTLEHLDEMADATRADAITALDSFGSAAENISKAGRETRSIVSDIAGRDDITFPQFSAEYKARTSSLAGNLAGMNDNFGLLNEAVNGATGVLVDDLAAISEQFKNIMLLYTDAIDGVLEMDYTNRYEDVSLDEAYTCTDATVDGCTNFGRIEADINTGGIAGAMGIENEYDKEGAISSIKNAHVNSSFMTKCVLRANLNYGEAIGEKNFVGGICGLQELGTIVKGKNYANIKSSSGERVGGIAGTSYGYIADSTSKGILSALNYVGGIAGDGNNISNCMSLVRIEDAVSWYGAIAGHISDKGQVRDNFFVSDDLAGIDRVSYSKKAEPVAFNSAVVSDLSSEFKKLTVTFKLDDDDAENGGEVIAKLKKSYGESIAQDEYPGLKNRAGYYISWDITSLDNITTDRIITATYKRYRTTISDMSSDMNEQDEFYQSELLVDGMFKEDDKLQVERTYNFDGDSPDLSNYETLKVTVPKDGYGTHKVRFKPINDYATVHDIFSNYLGGKISLYQIRDGERILLEPSETMGKYNIYDIEGDEFTLALDVSAIKNTVNRLLTLAVVILVLVLVLIIVIIIVIKKSGKHVPRLMRRFVSKVSTKIENKEQLFYDDSAEDKIQLPKVPKKKGKAKKRKGKNKEESGSPDNKE